MNLFKKRLPAALLALTLMLPAGCARTGGEFPAASATEANSTEDVQQIQTELVALTAEPPVSVSLLPVASGTLTKTSSKAVVDYSNTTDGYVMAKYTASTTKKLKVQVTGPSAITYTYDIRAGADWTTFPLSDGSGGYKMKVYENVSGTKYSTVLSVEFTAALRDEFAPFLRPNQYVDYTAAPKTIAKAEELCGEISDPLEKVKAVYDFVVTTLTYDKQKAATVQSGYLPVLDSVLAAKKGICFDYASLMTAMLRSQGLPCKLVVGYAGSAYHAWISVWTKEQGWVNGAIYFDGQTWQRMDPTFASSAKQSKSIMQYIGDGSHYTAKYLY